MGTVDTQPQIPCSYRICPHLSLSPIKMIQIIVFAAKCWGCYGGRKRGGLGWDLADPSGLAGPEDSGGARRQARAVHHSGMGAVWAPVGKDRLTGQLRGACSPDAGSSAGGLACPTGGQLDLKTPEAPPAAGSICVSWRGPPLLTVPGSGCLP